MTHQLVAFKDEFPYVHILESLHLFHRASPLIGQAMPRSTSMWLVSRPPFLMQPKKQPCTCKMPDNCLTCSPFLVEPPTAKWAEISFLPRCRFSFGPSKGAGGALMTRQVGAEGGRCGSGGRAMLPHPQGTFRI